MTCIVNINISEILYYRVHLFIVATTNREDRDIIEDMTDEVIGETPLLQQSDVREELRSLLEVGDQSGGDFQSLALTLVQLRNSRLESTSHYIHFS